MTSEALRQLPVSPLLECHPCFEEGHDKFTLSLHTAKSPFLETAYPTNAQANL